MSSLTSISKVREQELYWEGSVLREKEREREHFFDKVKDNPIIFTSK